MDRATHFCDSLPDSQLPESTTRWPRITTHGHPGLGRRSQKGEGRDASGLSLPDVNGVWLSIVELVEWLPQSQSQAPGIGCLNFGRCLPACGAGRHLRVT